MDQPHFDIPHTLYYHPLFAQVRRRRAWKSRVTDIFIAMQISGDRQELWMPLDTWKALLDLSVDAVQEFMRMLEDQGVAEWDTDGFLAWKPFVWGSMAAQEQPALPLRERAPSQQPEGKRLQKRKEREEKRSRELQMSLQNSSDIFEPSDPVASDTSPQIPGDPVATPGDTPDFVASDSRAGLSLAALPLYKEAEQSRAQAHEKNGGVARDKRLEPSPAELNEVRLQGYSEAEIEIAVHAIKGRPGFKGAYNWALYMTPPLKQMRQGQQSAMVMPYAVPGGNTAPSPVPATAPVKPAATEAQRYLKSLLESDRRAIVREAMDRIDPGKPLYSQVRKWFQGDNDEKPFPAMLWNMLSQPLEEIAKERLEQSPGQAKTA